MKSSDFELASEKVEHSNIQWINDWSLLLQYVQHLSQFSVTLPLLKAIMVLHLYLHLKRNVQLNLGLNLAYLQLRLNKVLV